MRATDADRESVHTLLQAAYADGRLTWDEFDSRSTSLLQAKTYDQLGALTTDLRQPVPYRQGSYPPAKTRTNAMAIASLACGIGQIFFWFVAGVPAIVLGHVARRQIRETGEAGDGMALAGLILGYIGVIGPLLAILAGVALFVGLGRWLPSASLRAQVGGAAGETATARANWWRAHVYSSCWGPG